MALVLAVDQGTTSSRAILFDDQGEMLGVAQREFEQFFPNSGWVEHDALEIWHSQLSVIEEVLEKSNIDRADLAAVGITNQRETTVVWDRVSGAPVYNAIVWQDRRTAQYMQELKRDGCEAEITAKTGLVADAYFSASKINWILDNVSGAREKANLGQLAFGTIDSWLVYQLTDGRVHITDVSNASRTMLYNIHRQCWDDELLEMFSIPRSMLSEVKSSSEVYGEVASGLPLGGVPIAGIAGDQQAALMGQRCFEKGSVKNTYGTGCFMLMNTGTQAVASSNQLLTTTAWRIGERTEYALEGSVFIGGAVVQWLRDGLGLIRTASDVEGLARSVKDNGGVYMVPAFTGLGAPHWDPFARGSILGISRGTTQGHFARAALESIAFQVADLVDAMTIDSQLVMPELRVDGGAAANQLLLQTQADFLQTKVIRPKVTESTALGAAYLAGLAVGVWDSIDDLKSKEAVDQIFEPRMTLADATQKRSRWREAVQRSLAWENQ